MKIWPVFSFVLLIHVAIIGLFLVQPGCQNRPTGEPEPSITEGTAETGGGTGQSGGGATREPQRPSAELDPAFNGGMASGGGVSGAGQLSAPRRPESGGIQRAEPEQDGLESVLEPVRQGVSGVEEGREYEVRAGDTLAGIARREGISLGRLTEVNGLDRNTTIYVGQTLLIPEGEREQSAEAAGGESGADSDPMGKTIEVSRGDTLSGLAKRHGTTVATLQAANDLGSETIYVGQSLRVPEEASSQPSRESGGERGRRASNGDESSGGKRYEVKSGDTPSAIAARYGISARELMEANGIADPRKLFVGQELRIPGEGDREEVAERRQREARSAEESEPTEAEGEPAERQRMDDQSEESELEEEAEERSDREDPLSALEALESDDLPFVEVEESEPAEGGGNSGN